MIEQEMLNKLQADGVCGGKNYPVQAPNNVTAPYSVYDRYKDDVSHTAQGGYGTKVRYDFTAWCNSYVEATALIESFRESLRLSAQFEGGVFTDKDPDDPSLWRILNLYFYIIE